MIGQEPLRNEMRFLHAGANNELVVAGLLHDLRDGQMVEAERGSGRRTWYDHYGASAWLGLSASMPTQMALPMRRGSRLPGKPLSAFAADAAPPHPPQARGGAAVTLNHRSTHPAPPVARSVRPAARRAAQSRGSAHIRWGCEPRRRSDRGRPAPAAQHRPQGWRRRHHP